MSALNPAFPSYTRTISLGAHAKRGMQLFSRRLWAAEVNVISVPRDAPAGPSVEEAAHDWSSFRAAFPTTERFTYLDTARKGLVPVWVEAAMRSWMADVYDNAGFKAFSMEETETARAEIASTFGAPSQCVALIKNTSEGMNIIAQGFGIQPGENVVISVNEHENNTFPWRYLGGTGIDVRILAADENSMIPLDAYARAIARKTRVVSVAWVSYGAGIRSSISEIAELARRHSALTVVDGIQATGILNQRVDALGADAVICGGHKTLLSLAGAGFLYMREDLIGDIAPPYAAKFSFTSLDRAVPDLRLAPDARRFEYGNPNFLGIWVQCNS